MPFNWSANLAKFGATAVLVLLVLVTSFVSWRLNLNLATASMIQLLLIVLLAREYGFLIATIVSVAALTSLNFFFVPPIFTINVTDPRNLVALGAFEACALIVSRLSAKAQLQTLTAMKERQDLQRLYEVSSQMLLLDRKRAPGPQIVQLCARELGCEAVALFDGELATFDEAGKVDLEMESMTRNAYFTGQHADDADGQTWYRALRLGAQTRGSLGIRGSDISLTMVNALTSLASIGLERARSFETESRALAERHTEQLRTAVLDSLAHSFKTPLTAIRAASSGLVELASLTPAFHDLAILIEEEAAGLDVVTNNLLRTARLDKGEIALQRERCSLQDLSDDLREAVFTSGSNRTIEFSFSADPSPIRADRQLLLKALSQIIDNAVRYSTPDSSIKISGDVSETEMIICFRNVGSTVPLQERTKIFERFYRLPGSSQKANGTGLGLSVTKTIVEAHNGRVWVNSDTEGTTFCVALPRDHRVWNE